MRDLMQSLTGTNNSTSPQSSNEVPFYRAVENIGCNTISHNLVDFSERFFSIGEPYLYYNPKDQNISGDDLKRRQYNEAYLGHRRCFLRSSGPEDSKLLTEKTYIKAGFVALQAIALLALFFPRVRITSLALCSTMLAIKTLNRHWLRFEIEHPDDPRPPPSSMPAPLIQQLGRYRPGSGDSPFNSLQNSASNTPGIPPSPPMKQSTPIHTSAQKVEEGPHQFINELGDLTPDQIVTPVRPLSRTSGSGELTPLSLPSVSTVHTYCSSLVGSPTPDRSLKRRSRSEGHLPIGGESIFGTELLLTGRESAPTIEEGNEETDEEDVAIEQRGDSFSQDRQSRKSGQDENERLADAATTPTRESPEVASLTQSASSTHDESKNQEQLFNALMTGIEEEIEVNTSLGDQTWVSVGSQSNEEDSSLTFEQRKISGLQVKTCRVKVGSPQKRVLEKQQEDGGFVEIEQDEDEPTQSEVQTELPACREYFRAEQYSKSSSDVEVSFLAKGPYLVVHATCAHRLQNSIAEEEQEQVLFKRQVTWIPKSTLDHRLITCLTESGQNSDETQVESLVIETLCRSLSQPSQKRDEAVIVLNAQLNPSPNEVFPISPHSSYISQIEMIAQQILPSVTSTQRIQHSNCEIKLVNNARSGESFFPNDIKIPNRTEAQVFRREPLERIVTSPVRKWKNDLNLPSSNNALGRLYDFACDNCDFQNPQVWKETKYLYNLCLAASSIDWKKNSAYHQGVREKLLKVCEDLLSQSYQKRLSPKDCRQSILSGTDWIEDISPGMIFLRAQEDPKFSPREIYKGVLNDLRETLQNDPFHEGAFQVAMAMAHVPLIDYAKSLRSMLTAKKPFGDVRIDNWFMKLSSLEEAVKSCEELAKSKLVTQVNKAGSKLGRGDLMQVFGNLPFLLTKMNIQKGEDQFTTSHIRLANPDIRMIGGICSSESASEFEALVRWSDQNREPMLYCDHLYRKVLDEVSRSKLVESVSDRSEYFNIFHQPLDGWVTENGLLHKQMQLDIPQSLDASQTPFKVTVNNGVLPFNRVRAEDVLAKVRTAMLQYVYKDEITSLIAWTKELEESFKSSLENPARFGQTELNGFLARLDRLHSDLRTPYLAQDMNVDFDQIQAHRYPQIHMEFSVIKKYLEDLEKQASAFPAPMHEFVKDDHKWQLMVEIVSEVTSDPAVASDSFVITDQCAAKCQVAILHALFVLLTIGQMRIRRFNNTCKDGIDRGPVIMIIVDYLSSILSEKEEFLSKNYLENLLDLFIAPAYMAKSQAVLPERLEVAQGSVAFLTKSAHSLAKRTRMRYLFKELSDGMRILGIEIPSALKDHDLWPRLDVSLGEIMRMDRELQEREEAKEFPYAQLFNTQLQFLLGKIHQEDLGSCAFPVMIPNDLCDVVIQRYCTSLEGTAALFNWISRNFGFVDLDLMNTEEAIKSNTTLSLQEIDGYMLAEREITLPLLVPHMRRVGYLEQFQSVTSKDHQSRDLQEWLRATSNGSDLIEHKTEYLLHIRSKQKFQPKTIDGSYYIGSAQQVVQWWIEKKDDVISPAPNLLVQGGSDDEK